MNNLNNKVQLIGRIGTDVEVRKFDSGNVKASFRMATSETYKDAQGNKQEETQWHNIIAWGKLAEILEKYTKKGSEIMIEGKIVYRSWETNEGVKKYITEIETLDIRLMGGNPKAQTESQSIVNEAVVDDGLPF
jgi:single-strand DNA-binding protein